MKINLILTLLIAVTFTGCIYEDGPKFSLRSKEARMINTWNIDKVYEEGVDKTDDYKSVYVNYKLDLKSDKNYDLSYKAGNLLNYSESGTWKLSDDKTKLLYTPKNGKESSWTILRLKNSEFWAEMSLNNKTVKIYFKD
jgi:hypothetical protein